MMPAVHGGLLPLGGVPVDTGHGAFVAHRFLNLGTGRPALAVARGALGGAPLPARVHSSCITSEAFGACDCDCAEQLDGALAAIAAEGRGVLFYLTQEGRGAGFAAKALDRMLVQASRNALTTFEAYDRLGLPHDQRRYDEVGAMCRLLVVDAPLLLLSNNPAKLGAVRAAGVDVVGHRPLAVAAHDFSRHYLAAKSASGHLLASAPGDVAVAPEPVEVVAPTPVPGAAALVRLASYMLPVRAGASIAWFRLTLAVDAARRRERILLAYGDGVPLVRLQRERLLERLPLVPGGGRETWRRAVEAMVAGGGGVALFLEDDEPLDEDALAFLAAALPDGRARLLGDDDDGLATGLARHGVDLLEPVALEAA